jgi:hypothetical protein
MEAGGTFLRDGGLARRSRVEIKVTIELTGEPSEIGIMLAELGSILSGEAPADDDDADLEWWTADRAGALVRELTDPSLRAVGIITDLAPRATFSDVQRRMAGLGLRFAPGLLSSLGFAVRRLGYPFPPFVRDYYQRAYLMDEAIARVLRPAIAEEVGRRGLTA